MLIIFSNCKTVHYLNFVLSVAAPAAGNVRIKLTCASVCHTDIGRQGGGYEIYVY